MSFPARVLRVLIASPSDVTEERELAVRTIQEWNNLNAAERQLVLLPLRWETHSAPEYGKRPQEVINRQVVDHCDLLIGIFWTRIGSPTGAADSGTIEEIERVATNGKLVMLYFSQKLQDPDGIDLEQLASLREFKKKTFPKALIETYSDSIEFKDKLARQLEIQLRGLLATEGDGTHAPSIPPLTDIVLHFADAETGEEIGPEITLETLFISVTDLDKIPDYSPPPVLEPSTDSAVALWLSASEKANANFYRQKVTHVVLRTFFKPIRFWLKNRGGVGARDVYIDLELESPSSKVVVLPKERVPSAAPSKSGSGYGFPFVHHPIRPDELIDNVSASWRTSMEVSALQPQRELTPDFTILVGAKESCDVLVRARIYADTLPEPQVQELRLRLSVTEISLPAHELAKELSAPSAEEESP